MEWTTSGIEENIFDFGNDSTVAVVTSQELQDLLDITLDPLIEVWTSSGVNDQVQRE